MKVGELRRALEGVPDDLEVCHQDEAWYSISERAGVRDTKGQRPVFVID